MPFTHYPKLAANIICAWVQPPPPDAPAFLNMPRFSALNRFKQPLEPGETVVAYQEAQNFTRFFGSIFSDQPLVATFSFSNDEVAPDGHWVTDENIHQLRYDAVALEQIYDPGRQAQSGKFFVTIFGRWLEVKLKNTGKASTELLRVFVRGSVF